MRTLHFWRLQFVILTTSTLMATSLSGCSWRRCCIEVGANNRPKLFSFWSKDNEAKGPSVAATEIEPVQTMIADSHIAETLSSDLPTLTANENREERNQDSDYYYPAPSISSSSSSSRPEQTQLAIDPNASRVATLDSQLAAVPSNRTSSPATIELPVVRESEVAERGRQAGSAIIDLGDEKILVEPFNDVIISHTSQPSAIVRQMFSNSTVNSTNPIRTAQHTVEPQNSDQRFSQQLQPNQSLLVKNHTVRDSKSVDLAQPEGFSLAPQAAAGSPLTSPTSRFGKIQDREVLIDDLPTLGKTTPTIEVAVPPFVSQSPQKQPTDALSTASEFAKQPQAGRLSNPPAPSRDTTDHSDTREIRLQARADFPYSHAAISGSVGYQPPPPPVKIAARPWSSSYQVPATNSSGIYLSHGNSGTLESDPDTQLFAVPRTNNPVPTRNASWLISPLPPKNIPSNQMGPQDSQNQSDIQLRMLPPPPPSSRTGQGN